MKEHRGTIALVIFTISALAHILTFIPALAISMTQTWWLHLATMGIFFAMILSSVSLQKRARLNVDDGTSARKRSNRYQLALMKMAPVRFRFLVVILFVYALVNFGAMMINTEGATPAFENEVYFLHHRGDHVRDLTLGEYNRMRAFQVRGFSGHWMIFSVVAMVYFRYVLPRFKAQP